MLKEAKSLSSVAEDETFESVYFLRTTLFESCRGYYASMGVTKAVAQGLVKQSCQGLQVCQQALSRLQDVKLAPEDARVLDTDRSRVEKMYTLCRRQMVLSKCTDEKQVKSPGIVPVGLRGVPSKCLFFDIAFQMVEYPALESSGGLFSRFLGWGSR